MIYQPYFVSFLTSYDNSFIIEDEHVLKIYFLNEQTLQFRGGSLNRKLI